MTDATDEVEQAIAAALKACHVPEREFVSPGKGQTPRWEPSRGAQAIRRAVRMGQIEEHDMLHPCVAYKVKCDRRAELEAEAHA